MKSDSKTLLKKYFLLFFGLLVDKRKYLFIIHPMCDDARIIGIISHKPDSVLPAGAGDDLDLRPEKRQIGKTQNKRLTMNDTKDE